MKHILSIVIFSICCAAASAQTIRTLGFNSTNGQIVANTTNLVFTNSVQFSNAVASSIQVSSLTLGLPDDDNALMNVYTIGAIGGGDISLQNLRFNGSWSFSSAIGFTSNSVAAGTRTNLSLGLPALTNTSNVTTMRALAGSTNTNHPFSGTISIEYDGNPPQALQVSNGIILEVGAY